MKTWWRDILRLCVLFAVGVSTSYAEPQAVRHTLNLDHLVQGQPVISGSCSLPAGTMVELKYNNKPVGSVHLGRYGRFSFAVEPVLLKENDVITAIADTLRDQTFVARPVAVYALSDQFSPGSVDEIIFYDFLKRSILDRIRLWKAQAHFAAISRDNRQVAVANSDPVLKVAVVTIMDLKSRAIVKEINVKDAGPIVEELRSLSYEPTGRYLVIGTEHPGLFVFYDAKTYERVEVLEPEGGTMPAS